MSQHSSLKSASVGSKHRNVLKRYERIRILQRQEKWGDRKTIYDLPKLKMIKLKMKKSKGPKEEAPEAAPQAGTGEEAGKTAQKPKSEKPKA